MKFGGNSTGGTFGVSFHNDWQNGELKLQLEGGTFGEAFHRDRTHFIHHSMGKNSYPTSTSDPHFIGFLWPFVLSHVWLVTHSVDHFPYRMGVPSINPIFKGYVKQ